MCMELEDKVSVGVSLGVFRLWISECLYNFCVFVRFEYYCEGSNPHR